MSKPDQPVIILGDSTPGNRQARRHERYANVPPGEHDYRHRRSRRPSRRRIPEHPGPGIAPLSRRLHRGRAAGRAAAPGLATLRDAQRPRVAGGLREPARHARRAACAARLRHARRSHDDACRVRHAPGMPGPRCAAARHALRLMVASGGGHQAGGGRRAHRERRQPRRAVPQRAGVRRRRHCCSARGVAIPCIESRSGSRRARRSGFPSRSTASGPTASGGSGKRAPACSR